MGLAGTPFVLGKHQRFFAMVESAFGTQIYPKANSTTNAEMKVLMSNFQTEMQRLRRNDARQSRSVLENITHKTSNTWEVKSYIMGSGTAGTPPDMHPLLLGAIGGTAGYTNTPATSDAYALNASQTALPSLSLTRYFPQLGSPNYGVAMESLTGACVNEMTISADGANAPTVTFAGFAKHHVHTGYSTMTGAVTTDSDIVVKTDDQYNFEVGSVIALGTDDGTSDMGYYVQAKSGRTLTLFEVQTGAVAQVTASNGAIIHPHAPSGTTAGSPISNNLGTLTITPSGMSAYSGPSALITGFELTVNNNLKPLDDIAFQQEIQDAIVGTREITGSMTFRVRRDLLPMLGNRKQFTAHDLSLVLGTSAGSIWTITADFELGFGAMDVPELGDTEAAEATITVPILGVADSAESEFVLTIT